MTSNNSTADKAMLQLFANGDKGAFGKLYDQYAPILFGIILKLTSDEKLAAGILSDCFVTVWQNRTAYKSEVSFLAWLLAISRPIIAAQSGNPTSNKASDNTVVTAQRGNNERQELGESAMDMALIYGMNKQEICAALQQPEESVANSIKHILVKQKVQR